VFQQVKNVWVRLGKETQGGGEQRFIWHAHTDNHPLYAGARKSLYERSTISRRSCAVVYQRRPLGLS
jgi:hypothetical protein